MALPPSPLLLNGKTSAKTSTKTSTKPYQPPYPLHLSMFDPPITTTGTVIDSPKENIYQVALPNGKIIVGHVAKAMIALHEQIKPDSKVKLELTPYDLSKGRIVAVESDSDTIK